MIKDQGGRYEKGAVISDCGKYRYELSRTWSDGPTCAFICLNPSTADDKVDDPTATRCVTYARDWGFGRLIMINAYAFRTTYPKDLKAAGYPVGELNDAYLIAWASRAALLIAGWGANTPASRHHQLRNLLPKLHYLHLTKDGFPGHPLFLRGDLKPKKWT